MKTLDPDSRANLETELCQPRPGNTPPWQWTAPPPRFQEGLAALEAFVAREGHALPLSEHMEGSFPLGRWVMQQRRLYQAGKLPDLRRRLLSAQPRWAWDWRASRWDVFLTALDAFAAREGPRAIVAYAVALASQGKQLSNGGRASYAVLDAVVEDAISRHEQGARIVMNALVDPRNTVSAACLRSYGLLPRGRDESGKFILHASRIS
ncbi:helicase associated domain-containing protein [Streptomyces sp. AK02-04a]|uniref:helicase associated domain-containing protein n=1 Tax=Streptomyces sp. AK02-04a TaxID=3028649 RepID=UPI0029B6ED05|nr:helicase associated domain-containing protein [Streptomyces sp. AK02-04a]MDX3762810.1 helicase associated domain-containing protein [Streptomyces sp. AK02-04a]